MYSVNSLCVDGYGSMNYCQDGEGLAMTDAKPKESAIKVEEKSRPWYAFWAIRDEIGGNKIKSFPVPESVLSRSAVEILLDPPKFPTLERPAPRK